MFGVLSVDLKFTFFQLTGFLKNTQLLKVSLKNNTCTWVLELPEIQNTI